MEKEKCPVCLEDEGEMLVLVCGHKIHKECCRGLIKETCPVCRRKVQWPEEIMKKIEENSTKWKEELENDPPPPTFHDMKEEFFDFVAGFLGRAITIEDYDGLITVTFRNMEEMYP